MKISRLLVLALGLGLGSCSKKDNSAPSKTNESASGNPITAPVDYLGAIAKAKKVSEKTIETTSINQAIQLFYAQEDRFPNDLNELVTKHYIGAVPPPPAGTVWEYKAKTGELKVVRGQ
jgi:hypothetical protein